GTRERAYRDPGASNLESELHTERTQPALARRNAPRQVAGGWECHAFDEDSVSPCKGLMSVGPGSNVPGLIYNDHVIAMTAASWRGLRAQSAPHSRPYRGAILRCEARAHGIGVFELPIIVHPRFRGHFVRCPQQNLERVRGFREMAQ